MKFFTILSLFVVSTLNSLGQTSVATFNIRYANDADGDYAWSKRCDKVLQKLNLDNSDIIGFQEVLSPQMDFLQQGLSNHASVGVGRDDGKRAGEFAPIFYKKSLFKAVASGNQWLSPTPSIPSLGWDAACIRLATWVVLSDLKNKSNMVVVNTHFDHVGHLARKNSSAQIITLCDSLSSKYDAPLVLMGDFNSPTSDADISAIVANFDNALCGCSGVPDNTYIGFPVENATPALIDHIFIKGLKASGYKVDKSNYGMGQLSDHLSVHCVLER